MCEQNFDALRDLVPFVQLKKRQKHPWMSVTFIKVVQKPATSLKVTLLHGCFPSFQDCTIGTKLRKRSQMFLRKWLFAENICMNIYHMNDLYLLPLSEVY